MMLSIQSKSLSRAEALRRIQLLAGKDLRPLADQYGVTVWKNGRKNKGWAGQVVEQYLGLPQNSLQAPDFGSWELKVVPLTFAADGTLQSTMTFTASTSGLSAADQVYVTLDTQGYRSGSMNEVLPATAITPAR